MKERHFKQADFQRLEFHLGQNWLSCGVFHKPKGQIDNLS